MDNASRHLSHLANQFNLTGAAAQKFHDRMQRAQALAIAGGALAAVGAAGIKAGEGLIHAATQFDQARAKFQALNLGAAVNADAEKFAKGTNVIGTSASTLMTTINDLHTVLGNYAQARRLAPFIGQMEFANRAVFGEDRFTDKEAQNMARVIEWRGGFRSDDEMRNQANFMQRVLTGTTGRVTPSEYLNFLKTGGVAARQMGNEQFYYEMEPIIQEMSGGRTGTALMSLYQNLVQGRTTKRASSELARLGLINPQDIVKGGGFKAGTLKGGDMAAIDPLRFLNEVLLPAFRKHGITDPHAIINEIGTILTNRTAASLLSLIYQQRDKIVKNWGIDEAAKGVEELAKQARGTISGGTMQVVEAWHRLWQIAGDNLTPTLVPFLNGLADALVKLGDMANAHPIAVQWILGVAGALTILATAAGGLLAARAGWLMFSGIIRALGPAMLAVASPTRAITGLFRALTFPLRLLLMPLSRLSGISWATISAGLGRAAGGLGTLAGALSRLLGPLGLIIGLIQGFWPKTGNPKEEEDLRKFGLGYRNQPYTEREARENGLPWPPVHGNAPSAGPIPADAAHADLSLREQGYSARGTWSALRHKMDQYEQKGTKFTRGALGLDDNPLDQTSTTGGGISSALGGLEGLAGRILDATRQGIKDGMNGVVVRVDPSSLTPHMEREAQKPPTGPTTPDWRASPMFPQGAFLLP